MRSIETTIEALEQVNGIMAAVDPSQFERWTELLGGRQVLIEELLFLLDSSPGPLAPDQAARLSEIWSSAEAFAERLRVHRALLRHELSECHRKRFLCQALSPAPATSNFHCQG